MANRFGKTVFSTYFQGDNRAPILSNELPPEEEVENPDPGGPGGGDIGLPTGGGFITTVMPNITRTDHLTDIYTPKGQIMTVSYTADGICTMMPKLGYEDMNVSYSTNGRVMTISWPVNIDEPSDSWYCGVEAFVFGVSDEDDPYLVLWDRMHIGKSASDILYKQSPQIAYEMRRCSDPNHTLIVPDGTLIGSADYIPIGLNEFGQPIALDRPVNGNHSIDGEGFNRVITVTTNVVVMSATPLGTMLDRKGQRGNVLITGNKTADGYNINGQRSTIAIKAKGFVVKNGYGGNGTIRAEKCAVDCVESIVDMGYQDFNYGWTGDGSSLYHKSSQDCSIEYSGAMTNNRLANVYGQGYTYASYKCRFSKNVTTHGCIQTVKEDYCQDFSCYGAIDCDVVNCLAVDDALYAAGTRRPIFANFNFINTNNANENNYFSHCMALNTVKGGFWNNSSTSRILSYLNHVVFWGKKLVVEATVIGPAIQVGRCVITNMTYGNYEGYGSSSGFRNVSNTTVSNLLIVESNAGSTSPDNVIGGSSAASFDNVGAVNAPDNISPQITGIANYVAFDSIQAAGVKYLSRVEPGGASDVLGLGADNVFCAQGRYGKFRTDNDRDVYNGKNGRPYVNWIQRSPWHERRKRRQTWLHVTSDGGVFRGNQGMFAPGVHPFDYINRFPMDLAQENNCPYIEDIYHTVFEGALRLWWRPVCPAYQSTINALDFYVDGVRVAANQDKRYTYFTIAGLNPGTRKAWIVCKDSTYGDSGPSRAVEFTIDA